MKRVLKTCRDVGIYCRNVSKSLPNFRNWLPNASECPLFVSVGGHTSLQNRKNSLILNCDDIEN